MAFLMLIPSFILACAILVEPMLTEPGFVRLGSAHKWALFEAGISAFVFAFLPCIVKWTREDMARERAVKAAAVAAAAQADEPFEPQAGSRLTYRG